MSNNLETYVLVRFSKRTGKIDTTLEAMGRALLEMWALQKRNTTKTKCSVIFNKTSGDIVYYVEGSDNFPKVRNKENLGNIEDFCPGLLAAVQDIK